MAVRLSGRMGRQTVGFLDVLTGSGAGQPSANYGVLRVKRDIGQRRTLLGGMLVDRRDYGRTADTGRGHRCVPLADGEPQPRGLRRPHKDHGPRR